MTPNRLDHFIALGTSGRSEDIDRLMHALVTQDDLATYKLVDYALSHVSTAEGVQRLRHYLFNGLRPQRNYAALYFKRRGFTDTLHEALDQGKIDWDQGFAE
jgi:hypothetical protein